MPTLEPSIQARVVTAIGEAAERPPQDPCKPGLHGGFGGGSNIWTREVPMYGRTCAGTLTVAQSQALTRVLLPLAEHPEPSLQRAAITSLGQLGTSLARPTLRRLAGGTPPATCNDEASCAVRDRISAATQALADLAEIPTDDEWQRHDKRRGAAP